MSAESLKDRGNEAFRVSNFTLAEELFTSALKIDPQNHLLFSNRSAAYCCMKKFDLALQDATICLAMKPQFQKGQLRRGAALHGLGRYDEAMQAYRLGYRDDSSSPELAQKISAIEADKRQYGSSNSCSASKPNVPAVLKPKPLSGWLEEQGRQNVVMKVYKKRWIKLEDSVFMIFKDQDGVTPKLSFKLPGAHVQFDNLDITISGPVLLTGKTLRASCDEERDRWIANLNAHIEAANSRVDFTEKTESNLNKLKTPLAYYMPGK